jgi:flagellin-like hook-associated protein FlgL
MSSTHEDVSNIEIGSAGSRLQETLLSIRSLRAAIADSGIQPASSERVSGEDYIRDEGAANDVIDLAKFQILNQSGASPLGQASQSAQSILQLLK